MKLPDFLIVGAMKAGTTSFGADLNTHASVYVHPKEVHYFNSEGNYNKGIAWYQNFFKHTQKPCVGEKTPSYSFQPKVPKRIYDLMPDVKLIWLLREPVSRCYSHYNFFLQRGMENLSFAKAIQREKLGRNKNATLNYMERSYYIDQIERYLNYFPRENMLFIKYEDYISSPGEVLNTSASFLGQEQTFGNFSKASKKNRTYILRSRNLQYYSMKLFGKGRVGKKVYRVLSKVNRKKSTGYPAMDKKISIELTTHFQPFNSRLETLTGLDLSSWNPTLPKRRKS